MKERKKESKRYMNPANWVVVVVGVIVVVQMDGRIQKRRGGRKRERERERETERQRDRETDRERERERESERCDLLYFSPILRSVCFLFVYHHASLCLPPLPFSLFVILSSLSLSLSLSLSPYLPPFVPFLLSSSSSSSSSSSFLSCSFFC